MKNIYFVRHGESRSNATGILEGAKAPLTEKGIAQAKLIAKRIMNIPADVLIASTMLRAQQTAEEISKKIGMRVLVVEGIQERSKPDIFYGMDTSTAAYKKIRKQFEAGTLAAEKAKGGESYADLLRRARKSLKMLHKIEGNTLVVVTHGVFLRAVIYAIIQDSSVGDKGFEHFLHATLTNNTGITYVTYDRTDPFKKNNRGWRLRTWNDSAHLG